MGNAEIETPSPLYINFLIMYSYNLIYETTEQAKSEKAYPTGRYFHDLTPKGLPHRPRLENWR